MQLYIPHASSCTLSGRWCLKPVVVCKVCIPEKLSQSLACYHTARRAAFPKWTPPTLRYLPKYSQQSKTRNESQERQGNPFPEQDAHATCNQLHREYCPKKSIEITYNCGSVLKCKIISTVVEGEVGWKS